MSPFLELSLEKYSRPVDLSQFETSLKLSKGIFNIQGRFAP